MTYITVDELNQGISSSIPKNDLPFYPVLFTLILAIVASIFIE